MPHAASAENACFIHERTDDGSGPDMEAQVLVDGGTHHFIFCAVGRRRRPRRLAQQQTGVFMLTYRHLLTLNDYF